MPGPTFPPSSPIGLVGPHSDDISDQWRNEAAVLPPGTQRLEKRYPGIFLRPFHKAMLDANYSAISVRDYCRNARLILGALGWQRDPTVDDRDTLMAITTDDVNGAITHAFSASQRGKAKTSWNLYAGWCARAFGRAVVRASEQRQRPSLNDMPETNVGRVPRPRQALTIADDVDGDVE